MIPFFALAPAILSSLMTCKTISFDRDLLSSGKEENTSGVLDHLFVMQEDSAPGTKFYVEEFTQKAVESLGWSVGVDSNGFYYLSSKGKGKILRVSRSNTALDVLCSNIVAVENTAISYQALQGNPDPLRMNNNTLGYIRSFNKNYVTDGTANTFEWIATAGAVDPLFVTLQDGVSTTKSYFSEYVSTENYCTDYHGDRPSNLPFYVFSDPVTGYKYIDLIHMFASIDGTYDWTLFSAGPPAQFVPCVFPWIIHDLVSWGGDLQQLANKYQDHINSSDANYSESILAFTSFESLMADSSLCFPETDLLADMDAVNITHLFLTGPGRSSDAIADYYGTTSSNAVRAARFIGSVVADLNDSWTGTTNEQFVKEIHNVMGLEWNGAGWQTSSEYTNPPSDWGSQLKFKILKSGNINPTENVRKIIAGKFCDYIFSIC